MINDDLFINHQLNYMQWRIYSFFLSGDGHRKVMAMATKKISVSGCLENCGYCGYYGYYNGIVRGGG